MLSVYLNFLQYPEHGFYQLQDRIILFLHDANNPNILGLIDGIRTTADDVKDNSLIEVVLSGKIYQQSCDLSLDVSVSRRIYVSSQLNLSTSCLGRLMSRSRREN